VDQGERLIAGHTEKPMARYQVILAYDGTDFYGYQRQVEERTIQGVFEDALRLVGWQGSSTFAAGRTDTGVHASGQVVAFDLKWKHGEKSLRDALNANLPPDVAVRSVGIRNGFHPRFDALNRSYRYRLYCQPVRDPLRDRYAWRVWPSLNLALLQQVAEYMEGEHDFAAFGTPPKANGSTIRDVSRAEWANDGDEFYFEITANAFLYHMVRRLVSYQVMVGHGEIEPSTILELFSGKSNEMVRGLAPPNGLCLISVLYATS